jgi:hypothetical protein
MAYAFSSRRLSNSVIAMVTLLWDLCAFGGSIPLFPKLVMYIGQSRQLLYKFLLTRVAIGQPSWPLPRFASIRQYHALAGERCVEHIDIAFVATYSKQLDVFSGTRNAVTLWQKFKERINPMTPRWTGYLVRALNEFASLTAACGTIDASGGIPIRAKASIDADSEHQSKQKKSSEKPRRRKYNRKG